MNATRERAELDLDGMTCASCAARIERKLNKLDGVDATVNFATERASVAFDPECVTVDELCGAVDQRQRLDRADLLAALGIGAAGEFDQCFGAIKACSVRGTLREI